MTSTDTIPANILVPAVWVVLLCTCWKEGRMLAGPPLKKEMPMASSMPASSALVRKACSLAALDAPLKFSQIT